MWAPAAAVRPTAAGVGADEVSHRSGVLRAGRTVDQM
jgi:hypothetical protein